ncbi:MAG TPA: BON domain-containing protein [Pyrinomonadaceae bacterium]|nr:BON domain-containing protein [Pyrinomonadaceae bacterium]
MRFKIAALIAVSFLLVMVGCQQPANENTTANVNTARSPSPTSTPTPAESANTNSRRAPTREDYESNKERYTREAKDAGRKIGTGLNDGWLWVKTRFDLAAADDLRDSTINVDVDNDVVTLSGTVATAAQKTKAEQIAKAVEGVKGVKNQLKVAPATNTNANTNKPNANTNRPKT